MQHARMLNHAPKLPRHVGAPVRFQTSKPHKFATAEEMYRMKYFDIVDTAVGRLNFRITNKAVPWQQRIC